MGEKKPTDYPSIDKPWLKYYREEAISAVLPTCTIFDYLYENNNGHYNRAALNYFSCKISYGKLFESIEKAARTLKQNGVNESDVVTVLMPALYALGRSR